jgi:hypothetical protein
MPAKLIAEIQIPDADPVQAGAQLVPGKMTPARTGQGANIDGAVDVGLFDQLSEIFPLMRRVADGVDRDTQNNTSLCGQFFHKEAWIYIP